MASIKQHLRYSTSALSVLTFAEGTLVVDLTKKTLTVHDGTKAGGIPLAREDLSNVSAATNAAAGKMSAAHVTQQETNTADILELQTYVLGYVAIDVSGSSDVTLTESQYENFTVDLTGTIAGDINVVFPDDESKHLIRNQTSGAYTITAKTATGTGVEIPQGQTRVIFSDGADMNIAEGQDAADIAIATIANLNAATVQAALSEISLRRDALLAVTESAASTFAITDSPARTAYAAGQVFKIKFPGSVSSLSGAPTLNVNGLGAKTLKKFANEDLVEGDIRADMVAVVRYDGTSMQILTPLGTVLQASDIGTSVQGFDANTAKLNAAQTWAAAQNYNGQELNNPLVKNLREGLVDLSAGGGGTQTINYNNGQYTVLTISTSTTTIAFSNLPATGVVASGIIELINGGSQTINWPGTNKKWAGGTVPDFTASGTDLVAWMTRDGGTTFHYALVGADFTAV